MKHMDVVSDDLLIQTISLFLDSLKKVLDCLIVKLLWRVLTLILCNSSSLSRNAKFLWLVVSL